MGVSGGDMGSLERNPGKARPDEARQRRSITVRIQPKYFTPLSVAAASVTTAATGGRETGDRGRWW